MKDLIYAIQDLFLFLFAPMDAFRAAELSNWWSANSINWMFVAILVVCMGYWLFKLNIFNKTFTERRDVVSHTFFK